MGKNSNPTMFALVFLNLIAQSFGRILREQGGSPIPTTTKQAYPPNGMLLEVEQEVGWV